MSKCCCSIDSNIPSNTDNLVIIRPTSSSECFLGLYNNYNCEYPKNNNVIHNSISEYEWENDIIDRINDTLIQNWPCCCILSCSYYCCLCTFGLSLLLPEQLCVNQAHNALLRLLQQFNEKYEKNHLTFSFIRKKTISWIEIRINQKTNNNNNNNNNNTTTNNNNNANTTNMI